MQKRRNGKQFQKRTPIKPREPTNIKSCSLNSQPREVFNILFNRPINKGYYQKRKRFFYIGHQPC